MNVKLLTEHHLVCLSLYGGCTGSDESTLFKMPHYWPSHVMAHLARICLGRLDLAALFTPSTPNRQNRNQVHWNICAGVRRSTPSSEVVQTEQSRDLFQKRIRIIACRRGNILYRLIYSGVLQSAQFYLLMWLFLRTPSTLKVAKSTPPLV